jgi:hypothetical protein
MAVNSVPWPNADIGHEKLESLAILMNMEQSNCRLAWPFCSNTDLDQSLASHTEMISVRRSSNDRYFCLLLSPESSFGRHCPMGENNFRFCYYWLLQCDLRIVALYLLNASMTLPPFEHHQTNGFSLMLSNLHILSRLNVGGISVGLIQKDLRSTLNGS